MLSGLQQKIADGLLGWAIGKSSRTLGPVVQQYYGQEVGSDENLEDYDQVYQQAPWVYASVFQIMAAMSQVPFYLFQSKAYSERDEVHDHWLLDLIRFPNPLASFGDIMEGTAGFLELKGEAFWALEKEESELPNEIWLLNPARVRLKVNKEEGVTGYTYRVGGESVTYDADEVVHFKYWNPAHDFRGQGSLTAARIPIISDLSASKWANRFFKQGARPYALGLLEEEITETQVNQLREKWMKRFRGEKNWHGVDFMYGLRDIKVIGESPKDADFIQGRKLWREEQLATHGVPPSRVGILEHANYANMKEQDVLFWQNILPKLKKIRDTMNIQIAGRYEWDKVFDFKKQDIPALQEDENARTTRQTLQIQWGIKNRNEVRRENGDEPYQGGDDFGLPLGWVVGGSETPTEEPPKSGGNGTLKMIEKGRDFFTVSALDDSLSALGNESELLDKATLGLRYDAAAKGGEDIALISGAEWTFLDDPVAQAVVREQGALKAKYITQSMMKRIRTDLVLGIQQGENIASLTNRVHDATSALKRGKYWATRIARTEVKQALNVGSLQAMTSIGIQRKVWISARDGETRESHLLADEESHNNPVPIDESFQLGSGIFAAAPGMSGEPGEDINCRCDVAPHAGGLKGGDLRKWTRAYQKAQDAKMEDMAKSWVPVLHRYLDGFTRRLIAELTR